MGGPGLRFFRFESATRSFSALCVDSRSSVAAAAAKVFKFSRYHTPTSPPPTTVNVEERRASQPAGRTDGSVAETEAGIIARGYKLLI